MCPSGPALMQEMRARVLELASRRETLVELSWDPPWDPRTDASPEAQAEVGLW
jgi:metal-sulfur cluster biosynthetic enzyme